MSSALVLLIVNLVATLLLTGAAWFVQTVHYPLLARVGPAQLERYIADESSRTAWSVTLPMLVELVSAVALVFNRPPAVPLWLTLVALPPLAVVWFVTVFVQVPRLAHLAGGLDPETHQSLIASNLLRTASWTIRSLLLVAMLGLVLR